MNIPHFGIKVETCHKNGLKIDKFYTHHFPQIDFGSLVQALYGIEERIARGLWVDSSPLDSKGKKSGSGPRSSDVGAIGTLSHRFSHRPQTHKQSTDILYHMVQ